MSVAVAAFLGALIGCALRPWIEHMALHRQARKARRKWPLCTTWCKTCGKTWSAPFPGEGQAG